MQDLSANVMGNPHSQHSGPVAVSDGESKARQLTLDMCNASAGEYDCIFTSGATGESHKVFHSDAISTCAHTGSSTHVPRTFNDP